MKSQNLITDSGLASLMPQRPRGTVMSLTSQGESVKELKSRSPEDLPQDGVSLTTVHRYLHLLKDNLLPSLDLLSHDFW